MAAMTVVVRGRVLFFCGPCIKKKGFKKHPVLVHTVQRSPNDVSSPRATKRSSLTCRELLPKEKSFLREGSDYSRGISMTSSSMISPCGTVMSSGGFLQLSPEKGLHQERENGPPNAVCMASLHETFPHFPVSPFRRSIPCRRQNREGLR